jgi:hypothetical protein
MRPAMVSRATCSRFLDELNAATSAKYPLSDARRSWLGIQAIAATPDCRGPRPSTARAEAADQEPRPLPRNPG